MPTLIGHKQEDFKGTPDGNLNAEQLLFPGRKGRSRLADLCPCMAVAVEFPGACSSMCSGNTRLPRCGAPCPSPEKFGKSSGARPADLPNQSCPGQRRAGTRSGIPPHRRTNTKSPTFQPRGDTDCPKVLHQLPLPATKETSGSRALFKQRCENYLPLSSQERQEATRSGIPARMHGPIGNTRPQPQQLPTGKPRQIHNRPPPDPGSPPHDTWNPSGASSPRPAHEEPTDQ